MPACAYEPVPNPSAGVKPRRPLRFFVWLLLLPPTLLLLSLLHSPLADETRVVASSGSGSGSSAARRPLPPPRAALTSFLREHHMVEPKPEPAAVPMMPFFKTTTTTTPAAKAAADADATASGPDGSTTIGGGTTQAQTGSAAGTPVMDIVYAINLPEDTSFFRIEYSEIEALFRQTVRHLPANGTNAAVRFHLLSNDDEAIGRMRAIHPALNVHDYRLVKPSNRSEAFLQRYVHQSVNPPEMERLCIWRWILMADYIRQLQNEASEAGEASETSAPRLILGIDTDVGLFQHPSRLLSEWKLQHWEDRGFETHQIALGAAMLWSPQGLESFASFIGDAYATPELAARRVKEWGGTYTVCRPARAQLLPCDANATKPEMWHMSDMDVLRAWILQNTAVRTRKEEERGIVVRQAKRASGLRLFLRDNNNNQQDGAPPTLMGIRPATNETVPSSEPEEVCMLHFQGPKSKELIVPFEAFLEGGGAGGGDKKKEEFFVLP